MRLATRKLELIHYFHIYAVADRIDFSHLSKSVIPTQQCDPEQVALSLLPSPEDDLAIRENICVLMSRVLFDNVAFFNLSFDGVINWHIEHEYYKEMSTKSDVVSVHVYKCHMNTCIGINKERFLLIMYINNFILICGCLLHINRFLWEFFPRMKTREKRWLKLWLTCTNMFQW